MLQPGQVLDPRYMTAFERKQLESLGWEQGRPVPGNAAELIRAAQQEALAEGVLPVPPDTPPLQAPEPVDINRLPVAKQRELYDALAQAGRFQQEYGEQMAATANLRPSVREALRVASEAGQQGPGVSVVDDRPPPPPPRAAAAPPPRPRTTGWPRPAPPEPAQPPPPPPPPEPDPNPPPAWPRAAPQPFVPPARPAPADQAPNPPIGELSDTGAVGITNCPHCSWDLKRPDPTEPTDDDKRHYLMAALGGPGHRFAREAALLAGSIKVGYRELTGGEADAALTQIADDVRRGRVVGDGEWWQRLMDYRMTQAIEYIDVANVGRVHEGVELDEIESDDGNVTPFPALLSHLLTNVLHSESIRRAVGQGFMRFQRLCEKLEANANDESFWDGIGSLH
jgi:hypothetical protein